MNDDRRVEVVQVRCSPGEKAAWAGEAARVGVSVSELVRARMNGGLDAGPISGVVERGGPVPRKGSLSRDAGGPASSPCPGDAPAGTRCKLCGKVH